MSKPRVRIYPVLKWVGGKRKIEDIILSAVENINKPFNYYEPFLGSAIVYLYIPYNKIAYINDSNKDLISIYKYIKNNHTKIIN